jgi:ATP-dependent helicase YprA (DUF1998 family)/very-short-patch-repair endonuclease
VDVFNLRQRLVDDYADFTRSFINIRDERISSRVDEVLTQGLLWPDPMIQLNPAFESGGTIDELVADDLLHPACSQIFRRDKTATDPTGKLLRLHRHQGEAIDRAKSGANYVLTTGTGSGKSLAYIVPIVDHVLRNGSGNGIQAIVVYPMNALANSQFGELEKFLSLGPLGSTGRVTFRRYTGQEKDEQRQEILASPPDILLTNYVMLDLILTRPAERELVKAAQDLRFLVLDELHTYRGRQGADVAFLTRRLREACNAERLQCVGTSATLAGSGTLAEQQREVARLATLIFGADVEPENVIGETLRRATVPTEIDEPDFRERLSRRVSKRAPTTIDEFRADPLASWIETTFGLTTERDTGILRRATPRPITGTDAAADDLATLVDAPPEQCARAIRDTLLRGYELEQPENGFPAFAFRVHQFFSRGETVFATLEQEDERYATTTEQQFAPGSERAKALFPLAFCRECGQEYYTVRTSSTDGARRVVPRRLADTTGDEESDAGFLYLGSDHPWPEEGDDLLARVPTEWLEPHRDSERVKRSYRQYVPRPLTIDATGALADLGTTVWWVPAPFRFCLRCGVSHGGRQPRDFGKLMTLGAGGRSSATTILTLAAIRSLRGDESLEERARKLLSFTDNRQDASLQAGHFNDFVEVGLIRSALYRAAEAAGATGLTHDDLALKVFEQLNLSLDLYAVDPHVEFGARQLAERALRDVLAYRLYRDLERGWRVTAPNLEQAGLLEIEYLSLDEVAAAEHVWQDAHPALATASAADRERVAKVLLDFMRRSLAIRVDYLDTEWQERLKQRSSQFLVDPWAIDEEEELVHASLLFPKARLRTAREYRGNAYLSARGGFGQYLRRANTLPVHRARLTLDDTDRVIRELLEALKRAGLVVEVQPARDQEDVPGYQLAAAMMQWKAGDGTRTFHDPIRVPSLPREGGRTNRFFVDFYRGAAADSQGIQAREHTAQVPSEEREKREEAFREAKLPVLFCSPTMELGVDIAELNVVNMRNIPPTPANYAQRSGRAGRSGQPALVFDYAAAGSSHDQYFFRRPSLMVSGQVKPPRLDLANEDLVRAHVNAIWLAETGKSLGSSLTDVLEINDEDRVYPVRPSIAEEVRDPTVIERARPRAARVLASIPTLEEAEWYDEEWLDRRLGEAPLALDRGCDRWRELYRAAVDTVEAQHRIVNDNARPPADRAIARRLRGQAETQKELLTGGEERFQSDFYSYRYFASEGFLPGYSFPRLPLSAFIPARRGSRGRDEFVQRPRFLAISEFGPRSIVYHEGSRYVINRVFLPVERGEDNRLPTTATNQCSQCGYLHWHGSGEPGPDVCEQCAAPLDPPITGLFRLQNVATKRRDRINSDEEDRVRQGFEIRTGLRFAARNGAGKRVAHVLSEGVTWGKLSYGGAATLWRINFGWTRRKNPNLLGFVLDTERGFWAKNEQAALEDPDDPLTERQERVIPFVEDRRNALLFEPNHQLAPAVMASLAAALKTGIQVEYDLEDSELAVEPLPNRDLRHGLLFYEAAEGGAGVLRLLASDPDSLPPVARRALELCHFDPDSLEDRRRAAGAREDCEAACYDCLLTYSNQPDHRLLDRHLMKDVLALIAGGTVEVAPGSLPRAEQVARLRERAGSELERRFLAFLDEHSLELPTHAQDGLGSLRARPDFTYAHRYTAVFIDGPPHNWPDVEERDKQATDRLENDGWTVIRVRHDDDWKQVVRHHPDVFGRLE